MQYDLELAINLSRKIIIELFDILENLKKW